MHLTFLTRSKIGLRNSMIILLQLKQILIYSLKIENKLDSNLTGNNGRYS